MEDLGLQASEAARLVIALLVLPGIIYFGRRLRTPAGGGFYMYATIAVYVSYVLTLAEGFWFPDLLNFAQHGCLAAAGVFALIAAVKSRAEVERSGDT